MAIVAVPFWEHREVAKQITNRQGKTIIDATNAFDVSVNDLEGKPSSAVVAKAFSGAADLERPLERINRYGETRTSIVLSTPLASRGIKRPAAKLGAEETDRFRL